MTVLGTVLQVVTSGALTLGPAKVVEDEEMPVTRWLSFAAILSASVAAGLIAAIPVTLALVVFLLWLRLGTAGHAGLKRRRYLATVIVVGIFLGLHCIHLPIRLLLGQPAIKIAINVAAVFLGVAMVVATLEWRRSFEARLRRSQAALAEATAGLGQTRPGAGPDAPPELCEHKP